MKVKDLKEALDQADDENEVVLFINGFYVTADRALFEMDRGPKPGEKGVTEIVDTSLVIIFPEQPDRAMA